MKQFVFTTYRYKTTLDESVQRLTDTSVRRLPTADELAVAPWDVVDIR